MPEYVLVVEFEVTQGDAEILLEAGRIESVAALSNEAGCKAFDISIVPGQVHKGLIYEVYADENAYLKHRETPHYAAFFQAIEKLGIDWKKSRYQRLAVHAGD